MTTADSPDSIEPGVLRARPVLRRLAEFEPPVEASATTTHHGVPGRPVPGGSAAGGSAAGGSAAGRPAPTAETTPVPPTAEEKAARTAVIEVLRRWIEVLDGRRPPQHLRAVLSSSAYQRTETVRRQLGARAAVPTPTSTARLLSAHTCHPAGGVVEVSAVCRLDGRIRALAARFEHHGRQPGWLCTVLLLLP